MGHEYAVRPLVPEEARQARRYHLGGSGGVYEGEVHVEVRVHRPDAPRARLRRCRGGAVAALGEVERAVAVVIVHPADIEACLVRLVGEGCGGRGDRRQHIDDDGEFSGVVGGGPVPIAPLASYEEKDCNNAHQTKSTACCVSSFTSSLAVVSR